MSRRATVTGEAGPRRRRLWALVAVLAACEAGATPAPAPRQVARAVAALPDSTFASLHARISGEGGYFDTDNLISNETGYLNVQGALERLGLEGGAYVGVGPDQNYSYIATLRPEIAFITDVRRDNALHHLLLKALIERAPTRVEFLAGLHGRPAPEDPAAWVERPLDEIVAWVDRSPADEATVAALDRAVTAAVLGYGIPLSGRDLDTIRRFHRTFVSAGLSLRFTSFGRRPRPYYPTYRQLVLETDAEGEPASYLVSAGAYRVVRDLHLANRIVPVVGDMAGPHALAEMGEVMREMGVALNAFYTSNVEFYLWRARTFDRWVENLASLPVAEGAVVIRSYFPNFGGTHPSALPGYYATQTLQEVATVLAASGEEPFRGYLDLVTRDVLELREGAGVR